MTKLTHKQIAVEFLKAAASGQVREAYDRYVGPDFHHHNPYFPGDATSLMLGMEANGKEFPNKSLEVHRALEDGNEVAVFGHVKHKPGDLGYALVHIFRFEGDRIAELWDIGQEVPAESVNQYGMF